MQSVSNCIRRCMMIRTWLNNKRSFSDRSSWKTASPRIKLRLSIQVEKAKKRKKLRKLKRSKLLTKKIKPNQLSSLLQGYTSQVLKFSFKSTWIKLNPSCYKFIKYLSMNATSAQIWSSFSSQAVLTAKQPTTTRISMMLNYQKRIWI